MYLYASKILPLLVMPVGVTLILCAAAAWLLIRGAARPAGILLASATMILWVSSTPWVAETALASLEQRHPLLPLDQISDSDCLVVLGGAVAADLTPRVDIELGEGFDRVYKAAQLYRQGKARRLIVSGGNQPWSMAPAPEADLIRKLLVELGVPEGAIHLDGESRNTRENAVNSKALADSIGCENALLVTSAAHMPRAAAAFRAVGMDVIPVSTDVRVVDRQSLFVMDFVPSAAALSMTSDALREMLGRAYYRFKGWN